MDIIIGIDLGTSTTEAAVYRDKKPVMMLNFDGKEVTPSVVGLDDTGNIIVGEKAQAQLLLAPERMVREVKRLIGTGERVTMGKRQYSPAEISAMILSYVRNYAGTYLDQDVVRAVISVPAYFDELQRQETMEAGRAAGFMVDRIINEPTAAALCYGLEHMDEESDVLVYDLGGGTFDVTLLEMFEGVLEVKASSGDNQLGGKDFDQRLVEYLVEQFKKKNGIDLATDSYAMARVRDEALLCKIALSTQEEYAVRLPVLTVKDEVPYAMDEVVTRAKFEELIRDLVERTHGPIDVVLADSGIDAGEIDKILLVGGSTRVPLVRRDIETYLGKAPEAAVDPDYAVAQGAAIQAAIISGQIDESSEIVMTDVNPFTLGVRALRGYDDDYMSVIIPRNKTIPTTKKQKFYTSWDGQIAASIEVYQGESSSVHYNHRIGEFILHGIPARKAGKEAIDVSFSYNQSGMLQVTGTVVSSGEEASIEINMLDTKEAREDVSDWKSSELAGEFRSSVRRAEKWLGSHADDKRADELLYQLKKALIEEDEMLAEELEEELRFYTKERR